MRSELIDTRPLASVVVMDFTGSEHQTAHETSYVSSRSESLESSSPPSELPFFATSHHDLINNESAEALSRSASKMRFTDQFNGLQVAGMGMATPNDWNMDRNRQRTKDAVKLIRSLFWAFEEVEKEEEMTAPGVFEAATVRWFRRQTVTRIVQHEVFSGFFVFLTFYALFGPDICMSFGHTAQNPKDFTLAIINTFVLFFFIAEEVLQCIAYQGYLCSGRFWIDTFATLSIIGDTWVGVELIKSDAAVAGRGSRIWRLLRVGSRSSRLVRLLRVARLSQVLRLVPRIQNLLERSSQELALVLWHKRVLNLLQFLDTEGTGRLDDESAAIFNMSMSAAFSERSEEEYVPAERFWNKSVTKNLGQAVTAIKRRGSVVGFNRSSGDMTLKHVVRGFFVTPLGQRAYQRCMEDIQCMKESCAIVQRSVGQITLKICIIVLMLLILMQLLEGSMDPSLQQGLGQLAVLAADPQVKRDFLCSLVVDEYAGSLTTSRLVFLALNRTVFWDDGRRRCDEGEMLHVENPVEYMDRVVQDSSLEFHEFAKIPLWTDVAQTVSTVSSAALFDTHVETRAAAVASIGNTLTVVILLMVVVMLFIADMKRLSNNNVLHPLWILMDDMCALKSIEILNSNTMKTTEAGLVTPSSTTTPLQKPLSKCGSMMGRLHEQIPVAEELLQLRKAFDKLHTAMLSWSKYVPVILLKQLFEAGVEAKIGCTQTEVSIFFCDIIDFRETTQDMSPTDVLALLEVVLHGVHMAIEDHGGTLLEFIGDEVLAVFNAPLKVEAHSMAAMMAALQARSRMTKEAKNVRLQCSVHTATVLCGNIGSPTRMKYGVLGDGVNLAARLKGLNSRYGTQFLVSSETLFAEDTSRAVARFGKLVTRPIGHLILKGRNTPTHTFEVLGKSEDVPEDHIRGADLQREAFALYLQRSFYKAKEMFQEAHGLISKRPSGAWFPDKPSQHFIQLCDKYIAEPPPDTWDGSEQLKKKSW
eukprot:TRINITY_DN5397_c0_g1_i1.p1 TRINITY_DN5397_c0_g1~~TRINITY_DN5397_c0_g1_i1.p1  ORF type:complete len:982 (-),score=181.89 TRINITY_DN5397_c0_g1_i1:170-3115(-)